MSSVPAATVTVKELKKHAPWILVSNINTQLQKRNMLMFQANTATINFISLCVWGKIAAYYVQSPRQVLRQFDTLFSRWHFVFLFSFMFFSKHKMLLDVTVKCQTVCGRTDYAMLQYSHQTLWHYIEGSWKRHWWLPLSFTMYPHNLLSNTRTHTTSLHANRVHP